MSLRYALLLPAIILVSSHGAWAEQNTRRVSLCSIQRNPESFLRAHVEVRASMFAGAHFGQLLEGKCFFRVAQGDDYQALGHRFRVKHDDQWALMSKLLSTPPPRNCSVNARIVRANIKGIVERVPATGTIPDDEMPMEIVILSVSDVVHVPTNCTPSDVHSSDTP